MCEHANGATEARGVKQPANTRLNGWGETTGGCPHVQGCEGVEDQLADCHHRGQSRRYRTESNALWPVPGDG